MTPHADWRGAYAFGTFSDGTVNPCSVPSSSGDECSYIPWPSASMTIARGKPTSPLDLGTWMGAVVTERVI